jgi:serine/threonine-protein kinase RsbW
MKGLKMKITKRFKDGILILSLRGELDMYNSTEFKVLMDQLTGTIVPRGILFNMDGLTYMDSSGIGILISLLKRTNQISCMTCFCYIQNQVMEVIKLTRILPLFKIEKSEKLAFQFLLDQVEEKKDHSTYPIGIDEASPLMDKEGMKYKQINLEYKRIRYMSHLITHDAPKEIREYNLLEQQISEIIKNGVRHGNKNDIGKSLKIWWKFTDRSARLIVEDEGQGFQNLESWIDFYRKRMACVITSDYDKMTDYLSYRTSESTVNDGGNALFAAVEFWNQGVVLNKKRNAIAVARHFEIENAE